MLPLMLRSWNEFDIYIIFGFLIEVSICCLKLLKIYKLVCKWCLKDSIPIYDLSLQTMYLTADDYDHDK